MPRTTRRAIERGIYKDEYGFSAVVTVNYHAHEKRFPPDTPVRVMRDWRRQTDSRFRRTTPARPARGTLAKDIETYKRTITHLVSAPELASVLKAWVDTLGTKARWRITPDDVRTVRAEWVAEGVAPKTINNRTDALRRVYRVLDGKDCWTPCDEIDKLAVPRTPPRFVSPETIRAVYAGLLAGEKAGFLRDSKTRARFAVLASSGVRPSELMRAVESDVDLERRVWRTRDGKGGLRPGGMYLTDDLLFAWKLFLEADAFGEFNTGSFAKRLREAGWPKGVRPYQLRHTVGLALSEAGADLADVAAVLGHSRPLTTRSHYVPVLGSRLQAAMTSIGTRIQWDSGQPVEKRSRKAKV